MNGADSQTNVQVINLRKKELTQPLGPWTLTECNYIYLSTVQARHACTLLKYFHLMLINLSTPPYIAEGKILFFTPQHLLHKKYNMI